MVIYMKHWKRICCGILVLLLVVSCLPASVFALELKPDTYTAVFHYQIDEEGNYNDEFPMYGDDFTPKHFEGGLGYLGDTANLWVYTKSMREDEREPGSCVPYLIDDLGNKWELSRISLANHDFIKGLITSSACESLVLMDENDIQQASKADDYIISTTNFNIVPGKLVNSEAYAIIYGWKLVEKGETPTQYTVSYNANLPTEVNKLFPVAYTRDTGDKMLDIDEGIGVNPEWMKEIEGNPTQVYASQPYTVSDYKNNPDVRNYCDFLVFDTSTKTYYDFGGWRVGDNVYQIGDEIENLSALADQNGNIEFSGVWNKIEPLNDSELYELYPKLNLDVFHRDNAKTDEDVLLTQQTNTDENLSTGGKYTSQPVTLDENGVISYRLAGKVSPSLTSTTTTSGGSYITYSKDFCSYTITLNVDGKLEFAYPKADGTVSLSFTCPYLEPQKLNVDGATIAPPTEPDTYTITFNPKEAHTDPATGAMQLVIDTQWIEKNYGGKDPLQQAFVIEGLDFKLKDKVSDPASFEIHTSANISGSMDQAKMSTGGQIRYYYANVQSQYRQNAAWQKAFGEDYMDPTNYAHAVQFFDYKLAKYDLSTDTSAYVKANTVTATYPGTVTIKPADITIYMGGDGGYDAVVGEGGTAISNSLPHPLFEIDATSGIDPADLTFTNGNKTWTVISDGNGYYHFSEDAGQEKVRVTYTYTDKDGEKHVVTDDMFDPTVIGDVFATCEIALYPGNNDLTKVTVSDDKGMHNIVVKTGTLTVRAVADKDPTSDIATTAPVDKIASETAVAVVPEGGTTYTLNNTGVPIPEIASESNPDGSKPSLLFDHIIEDEGSTARTDALKNKVDEKLGAVGSNTTRHYEIKYLDLVDANNGNAWITSSAGMDIYWGYPEGTDQSTEFTLLHFEGLHRDGENSGFNVGDIAGITPEKIDIEKTETGIKFHISAGGFSPFALVYDTQDEEPVPETVTVTFDSGEHGDFGWPHVTSKSVELTKGGSLTATQIPTVYEDAGYEFIGWYKQGSGSRYLYSNKELLEKNFYSDATFIAQYEYVGGPSVDDEYDVIYNANFTDGGYPRRMSYDDGDKVTVSENNWFEREGYTFIGWNTKANGNGVSYQPGDTFRMPDSDVYLYAQWQKNKPGPDDTGVSDWLNTKDHIAYMTGYPDKTFGPNRNMTRAEVAQMFYALLKNQNVTVTAAFSDVPANAWYAKAVNTMATLGMVTGYPDGTFHPDATITRAEFTTIALAFADGVKGAKCSYYDVPQTAWFYDYIAQATEYGWIGGSGGYFRPNDMITRAEVSIIVNNMLGRDADERFIDRNGDELVSFTDLTDGYWAYYAIMEATNTHTYTRDSSTEVWKATT